MRDVPVCSEVSFDTPEISLAGVLETQGLHDAAIDTTVARASVNQTKKRQGFGNGFIDAARMPDLDQQSRSFLSQTVRFVRSSTVNDRHEAVRISGMMATERASCGLREPGTAFRRTVEWPLRWPPRSCHRFRPTACPQTRPTCANAWLQTRPSSARRRPSSPGLPAGSSPYPVVEVARPTTVDVWQVSFVIRGRQPARAIGTRVPRIRAGLARRRLATA